MLIGFNLPLSGPTASPAALARLAAEGEAIGYDYAAISDHIVEPTDIHARYPYTESGEFPASSRGERHEQVTVIAYLAAKTSRLKFLTRRRLRNCWRRPAFSGEQLGAPPSSCPEKGMASHMKVVETSQGEIWAAPREAKRTVPPR